MFRNIDRKTFLIYLLPALPILCLGIAMLIFVFSLEYQTYSSTFSTATTLPSETTTPLGTVGPNSTEVFLPANVQPPAPAPTKVNPTPDVIEAERERFSTVFKDIALVVAASIITFSSSYVGGLIQSLLQREQENRLERREQAKRYKEYLETILRMGQRKNLLERLPVLREYLPRQGKDFEVTEETVNKMINDMPLALGLRALDNEDLQKEFDEALQEAIVYLVKVARNERPDYNTMNDKYNKVVKSLMRYANEG